MRRYIARLAEAPRAPEEDPRPWLLDALIRADADVPAATLEPLFGTCPEQVIILLAKNPDANREALLRLMDGAVAPLHWMAIADILGARRPPGLASRVLRRLEPTCFVAVLPSANMSIGLGGGDPERPRQRVTVRGKRGLKPGWPPFVRYTINDEPRRGDIFLAGAVHRVYYRRELVRGDRAELLDVSPTYSDSRFCLDWVSGLGRGRQDLSPSEYLSVVWAGGDAFLADVAKRRKDMETRFGWLLDYLERIEMLTPEERPELKLRVRWDVEDLRRAAKTPIPEIPGD